MKTGHEPVDNYRSDHGIVGIFAGFLERWPPRRAWQALFARVGKSTGYLSLLQGLPAIKTRGQILSSIPRSEQQVCGENGSLFQSKSGFEGDTQAYRKHTVFKKSWRSTSSRKMSSRRPPPPHHVVDRAGVFYSDFAWHAPISVEPGIRISPETNHAMV